MILVILGYTLIALVVLIFIGLALRDYLVKRMSSAFELGAKLERVRHQISPEAMEGILRDAGIDPADLPFGDAA